MSKRRKSLSDEDHILWEKVKRTVRQSTQDKFIRHKPSISASLEPEQTGDLLNPAAQSAKPIIAIDPTRLFTGGRVIPARKSNPILPQLTPASLTSPEINVDPATRKRIVKGRTPIDATLDLHGLTQDQARLALSRFVQTARKRGDRTIIIVTGKGSSPKSEGVLRRMVPLWLRQSDLHIHISGFSSAARHHGGDGAYYIRLKRV